MRDTTRVGRGDDGAAAVEFALISLPLMLLLFGTIQYGLYFFQATAAEHGLREGARLASVGQLDCDALAQEIEVRSGAAGIDPSTVRVTFTDQDGSAVGEPRRGDTVTVEGTWEPVDVGVLPLPPSRPERVATRVEYLDQLRSDCP